jgi:mRNA degradation ribonuclease J1/J2
MNVSKIGAFFVELVRVTHSIPGSTVHRARHAGRTHR